MSLVIKPYIKKIKSKLKNKKFSLQFLPSSIESLSTQKKVFFKGRNLKVDYLIDIIHNLILKYYFKKENLFALNSVILKEKYGQLYNYYIEYLINNNLRKTIFKRIYIKSLLTIKKYIK